MLRFALVPVLLAPFLVQSAPTQLPPSAPLEPTQTCCNSILHEPFLVYDVAGSTLAGPVFRHLVVYDDGHAMLAAAADATHPGGVATAQLTRAEVQALRNALVIQGAWSHCDDDAQVSDVPVKTVTVLQGTTNAIAHSYSYRIATAGLAGVEQRIEMLIALKFPGF